MTAALPEEARAAAQYGGTIGTADKPKPRYDFCLPAGYASWSLLPEVREGALALFDALDISWHAGIRGGPSNHLLSSQVQCVNALGQMVHDPERLQRAFAGVLGTADVLEIEPGRFLTFEYIGPTDYFNEAPGRERVRGANCTSVDAAFLHRTADGLVELVLIEWKYTESYGRRNRDAGSDAVRWERYGPALTAPDGPVRSDLLAFEDLLAEPFFQLMRQQLLAHELEKAHAHGADRVRVLHVTPAGNTAYQRSLPEEAHKKMGDTVSEVWQKLLRSPDRFVSVDSSLFCDPKVTSNQYDWRYGDHLVLD